MKINFCAPFLDSSGYAEFARYFISALDSQGINVTVENIPISPKNIDFGPGGKVYSKLERKKGSPDINIVNMIPTLFSKHKMRGCKNVGFTMWESSELPKMWVKLCNEMDAIMVPSTWNKDVFFKSGVTVPIYVVQPGVDVVNTPSVKSCNHKKEFKFYSVFQYLERKNPCGLLRAYYSEFTSKDKVSLILKTSPYVTSKKTILEEIKDIRRDFGGDTKSLPKVHLIQKTLSSKDMMKLYGNADCFVLPHRAEGWSMGHMTAMSLGKPVIGTNYSGNTDFMNVYNSYMLNYQLTPVAGIKEKIHWYEGNMWWAEPDLEQLCHMMREIFQDRELASKIGMQGRKHILENFNFETSAKALLSASELILRK